MRGDAVSGETRSHAPGGPLAGLPVLTHTTSRRASSWDRTGGNDDRLHVAPGSTAELARIDEPGVVRHVWMTIACSDRHHLRRLVLRAYRDGEDRPASRRRSATSSGAGTA